MEDDKTSWQCQRLAMSALMTHYNLSFLQGAIEASGAKQERSQEVDRLRSLTSAGASMSLAEQKVRANDRHALTHTTQQCHTTTIVVIISPGPFP